MTFGQEIFCVVIIPSAEGTSTVSFLNLSEGKLLRTKQFPTIISVLDDRGILFNNFGNLINFKINFYY